MKSRRWVFGVASSMVCAETPTHVMQTHTSISLSEMPHSWRIITFSEELLQWSFACIVCALAQSAGGLVHPCLLTKILTNKSPCFSRGLDCTSESSFTSQSRADPKKTLSCFFKDLIQDVEFCGTEEATTRGSHASNRQASFWSWSLRRGSKARSTRFQRVDREVQTSYNGRLQY